MENLIELKEMLEHYLVMTNKAIENGGGYIEDEDIDPDEYEIEETNYDTIVSDLAYEIKTLY